jgi:hypothetical protein
MHSLGNDFGAIAVIAPDLRQSPEAGSYSAAAGHGRSASPGGFSRLKTNLVEALNRWPIYRAITADAACLSESSVNKRRHQ